MFSFRKLSGGLSGFAGFGSPPPAPRPPVHANGGPAAPPPVAAAREGEEQGEGEEGEDGGVPAGVLAYNFADSLVVLDLATHARFDSSPGGDAQLTLRLRSAPTAHALAEGGGCLRLAVGCVSGEVCFWEDVRAVYGRGEARRRAGGGAVYVGVGESSGMVVFNRDGGLNGSRVIAVRWLPGAGTRFIAVHVDGALVMYDTRNRKASAAASGNAEGAGGGGAAAGNGTEYANANGGGGGGGGGGELGGAALVGGPARQQSNGHLFANGSTSSGASSKSNGFLSSLASIADGATGLGLSDRERDKSGLSEKSLHASESRPGHRRSASLPPGQIGKHDLLVTRPSRSKRVNPIAIWQVGCSSVADAAFAPALGAAGEHVLLAIAGRDGYLRVVDVTRERMVVAFRSYFGALLCAAWSPDGRYVAAGGEDDLVSIWCPAEERIIARCEGHTSWVSSVAWDAMLCRDGRYRLGSAGQDAKLLLWDFSLDMLVTPSSQRSSSRSMVRVATGPIVPITGPAVPASTLTLGGYGGGGAGSIGGGGSAAASHPQQTSAHVSVAPSSTVAAPAAAAERRPGKLARLRGHHTGSGSGMRGGDETEGSSTLAPPGLVVDALRRAEVPIVEPVLTHVAHVEPLTAVCFLDTGVVTADCVGNVKVWARPPQELVPPLSLARTGDLD